MSRVTTAIRVSAMMRRVQSAGGFATILAKGDLSAGAILLILRDKGLNPRLFEPILDLDGDYRWHQIPVAGENVEIAITEFCARRRQRDPDLWIVELDVPYPERFIDGMSR